jgi:hypothetical protein
MRSSQRIKRASKRHPCPLCKGEGCGIADAFLFCYRVQEGSLRQSAKTGSFIHRRSDADGNPLPIIKRPPPIIAPIERRHDVYTAWLSGCDLSDEHAGHLRTARGLSDATIIRQQFRSVPSYADATSLFADIEKYYDLRHVPGFYFDEERQSWRMRFVGQRGFYIPLRDELGRIHALQIRRDTDDHRARYWMVSTPPDEFKHGAVSGVPPHFVGYPDAERLIITEGGLKAIVASECLPQVWMCGLVAVGSFDDNFGWYLRQRLPKVTEIAIAYDSDWRTNAKVEAQMTRLKTTLANAGYSPIVLEWPADQGKGFDDYLLNQRREVTA